MTDDRLAAQAIYDELRTIPGFVFPAGNPRYWTAAQCAQAVREGSDDSAEWIAQRRHLIALGLLS